MAGRFALLAFPDRVAFFRKRSRTFELVLARVQGIDLSLSSSLSIFLLSLLFLSSGSAAVYIAEN
jgi:hypothetical protein